MRVLHIITGLSTGGAEMMLLRLVDQLRGRFDQQVVSLTDAGAVAEKLIATGIPVTALGMSPRPNPYDVMRLAVLIRRLRPDVVQTWLYHADLMGGIAARMAGVRALAWNIRNNDLSADKTKARTRLVVEMSARLSRWIPARIVCCSQVAMDTHVALGYDPDRFVVIPNGFDLSRFKPDADARASVCAELGIPKGTRLLGLIARFDPQKNHAGFFEAAGRLHQVRPEVHFVLAGRGIDHGNAALVEWMRGAGVEAVTHLLGERQDIPRLTAALDLATCSSWGEAFPNVLGEAMACSVPCVSTDAGDAAAILGDTGIIVPRGSMNDLAQAWHDLLVLPEERLSALGERARARVAEKFEIGAIAARYATLYEDMAMGR